MNEENQFNAFAPLMIVFIAMIIAGGIQLKNNVQQKRQLQENLKQIQLALPETRAIDARLTGICRDLLDLSAKDSTAKKIVQDFNIRSNEPATKK